MTEEVPVISRAGIVKLVEAALKFIVRLSTWAVGTRTLSVLQVVCWLGFDSDYLTFKN